MEKFNIYTKTAPTISRAALEAYERQCGLPDVARYLEETGKVIVIDSNRASGPGAARDHDAPVHA